MRVYKGRTSSSNQDESHWLPVSDLMAGLMMVFLFIAVALMRYAMIEKDKIKDIAVAYQQNQVEIYEQLQAEFSYDLDRWDAQIDKDSLTFTFKSPDILFDDGSAALKPQYKLLLEDFFPRYMAVLNPFKDSINEVRIEGHTSSDWNDAPLDTAYFLNMDLSQKRTRSVLQYIYMLPAVSNEKVWMNAHIAAVGLSSSKLVLDSSGLEDRKASKRVSFRVITNSDTQIRKILED